MMMKKFLIFMLVLCFAGAVSAAEISFIAPEMGTPGSATVPLGLGEAYRLYLGVSDNALDTLSMTITGGGITGGILASEAGDYGSNGTYFDPPGIWFVTASSGWQPSTSADTFVSGGGTMAEMGLSQVGNVIHGATTVPVITFDMVVANGIMTNTPIAYIDIIGTGINEIFSMFNGSRYGSTSIETDLQTVPGFGNPVTIYGIPEPMTICLLGLGGLLLRRRK